MRKDEYARLSNRLEMIERELAGVRGTQYEISAIVQMIAERPQRDIENAAAVIKEKIACSGATHVPSEEINVLAEALKKLCEAHETQERMLDARRERWESERSRLWANIRF